MLKVIMKKLFIIPAIIATAFTAAAEPVAGTKVEKQADDVFFVGEKWIKFSDKSSMSFEKLIGYKTEQEALKDARTRKNGVKIGLICKMSHCSAPAGYTPSLGIENGYISTNKFYIIKDEQAVNSWFVLDSGICGDIAYTFLSKITPQTVSKEPFKIELIEMDVISPRHDEIKGTYKFDEATQFITKFDSLSTGKKADYLTKLKKSFAYLSSEQVKSINKVWFFWGSDVLDSLVKKTEYSKEDKISLFIAEKISEK
jgi:hypothetical protein